MKGHWSRVNLVKREELLKDLHATSVLSFPNANKKVYFNPYIYTNDKICPYWASTLVLRANYMTQILQVRCQNR